jgi:hypothetical protein
MMSDIREAFTLRELAEMLIHAEDNPFDAPFDGDTPMDDFECVAIGRQLLRLLNTPSAREIEG